MQGFGFARADFDAERYGTEYLSISRGENVELLGRKDRGWAYVRRLRDDACGWIPLEFWGKWQDGPSRFANFNANRISTGDPLTDLAACWVDQSQLAILSDLERLRKHYSLPEYPTKDLPVSSMRNPQPTTGVPSCAAVIKSFGCPAAGSQAAVKNGVNGVSKNLVKSPVTTANHDVIVPAVVALSRVSYPANGAVGGLHGDRFTRGPSTGGLRGNRFVRGPSTEVEQTRNAVLSDLKKLDRQVAQAHAAQRVFEATSEIVKVEPRQLPSVEPPLHYKHDDLSKLLTKRTLRVDKSQLAIMSRQFACGDSLQYSREDLLRLCPSVKSSFHDSQTTLGIKTTSRPTEQTRPQIPRASVSRDVQTSWKPLDFDVVVETLVLLGGGKTRISAVAAAGLALGVMSGGHQKVCQDIVKTVSEKPQVFGPLPQMPLTSEVSKVVVTLRNPDRSSLFNRN